MEKSRRAERRPVRPLLLSVAAALVLVFAAAPVFAHGSKEKTATQSGTSHMALTKGPDGYPAYNGPATTITMWAWTSNENYAIKTFEKAYPKIKVKWNNVGGGSAEYNKVMTATSAGKGLPDVIMSEYLESAQLMEYGSFQPINKWVPVSEYLKYYPKYSLSWTSLNGKLYGTPQDSGAMVMVYRKDIYDKYGLKVPKTWTQFEQQAARLHQANPRIKYANFPFAGSDLTAMVEQAGGRLFDHANGKWYLDFTNPTALKVYHLWNKMTGMGAIDTTKPFTSDWFKQIDNGQIATIILGAWFPEWLQLNSKPTSGKWRVALPPQWNPSKPHNGVMGGSGFFVSKQSQHPEAAALFVLWLNSQKGSLEALHNKSQLPVLVSTNFTRKVAPLFKNTKYAYFGGQKITPIEVKANSLVNTSFAWLPVISRLQSDWENGQQNVFSGNKTVTQVMTQAQSDIAGFMKKQGFSNLVVGKLPQASGG